MENKSVVDNLSSVSKHHEEKYVEPFLAFISIDVGVALLTVVLTVLITMLFVVCKKYGHQKRDGVLLVGLCDAGKTLLFSQLIHKKFMKTQTSMKPNIGALSYLADKKVSLKLVDVPGHEKVRKQVIDQFRDSAKAVVFVVDSSTVQKEIKDVAEFLYKLLTDESLSQRAPQFLIACNKADQTLSKGSKVIQTLLEREINTLRLTQSASLATTDGASDKSLYLGRKGKDFQFVDLKSSSVEFVECSCRSNKSEDDLQLKPLSDWLIKIAN